jgi:hypothetical protein
MLSNQDILMFGSSHESMDKTDWNALDYSCCRDESWYRKHLPGFDEEVIRIWFIVMERMLERIVKKMNGKKTVTFD